MRRNNLGTSQLKIEPWSKFYRKITKNEGEFKSSKSSSPSLRILNQSRTLDLQFKDNRVCNQYLLIVQKIYDISKSRCYLLKKYSIACNLIKVILRSVSGIRSLGGLLCFQVWKRDVAWK